MNWALALIISGLGAVVFILALKQIFDGMADTIDKECDVKLKQLHDENEWYIKSTDRYITEYLRRCGYDAWGRRIK